MKLIGYWISSLDDELPPPQELLADYTPERRQAISDYLDAGATFRVYRGMSWCRFHKCKHPMGHRELTDGVWVWPEGLSHYVRDHHVRLPEEFVQHAMERFGQPITVEESWSSVMPCTSFWKTWCAEHRSHILRPRIAAACQRAAAQAQQIRLDTIAACERAEGLSTNRCKRRACTNFALATRVFCAACMLESEIASAMRTPYYNLSSALEPPQHGQA